MGTSNRFYRPYKHENKTYFEALETCQNDGATLIEFRSDQEYEIAKRMTGKKNICVGKVWY